MRILIIDDDSEGVGYLSTFLQLEGATVYSASCGEEGLRLVQQLDPHLVILDVLLPEVNGTELCKQIRLFSDVPILILTGIAVDLQDQVDGLQCGADDYLIKPVDFDLLKARLFALLRRASKVTWAEHHHIYVDPHLIIDLSSEQVYVDAHLTSLSDLEYRLLEILVRSAGQVVPLLEIAEELWGEVDSEKDYPDRVHTLIRRLRWKIEPDPSAPCYIVTEHGLGYRFVPYP